MVIRYPMVNLHAGHLLSQCLDLREGDKNMSKWSEYEAQKSEWIAKHPAATPKQYQEAMASIARKLGL